MLWSFTLKVYMEPFRTRLGMPRTSDHQTQPRKYRYVDPHYNFQLLFDEQNVPVIIKNPDIEACVLFQARSQRLFHNMHTSEKKSQKSLMNIVHTSTVYPLLITNATAWSYLTSDVGWASAQSLMACNKSNFKRNWFSAIVESSRTMYMAVIGSNFDVSSPAVSSKLIWNQEMGGDKRKG